MSIYEKFLSIDKITETPNGIKVLGNFPTTVASISKKYLKIKTIPFKLDEVEGNCILSCFPNLVSLYNSPEIVNLNFDCSHTSITNLKYFPKGVGGSISINDTPITSLAGLPTSSRSLSISSNNNLHDLEYCTKHIDGKFYCSGNENLTSLKGFPMSISDTVYLHNLPNLPLEAYIRLLSCKIGGEIFCDNEDIQSILNNNINPDPAQKLDAIREIKLYSNKEP